MSTATHEFKTDAIGEWSEPDEFEVTREGAIAYARATNDTTAQHLSGELAAPVFAIVPAFPSLGPTALKVIPMELIGMILHGEQDFRFHQPIVPGMTLVSRAAPVGLQVRSSGVTVVVKIETTDKATAAPVCDQYGTIFVRGAQAAESIGEAAPAHGFPEALRTQQPLAEVAQTFDADQTYRYSEASGDPMPIHLDDDFAKSMGLPGIIIHGLCTMAFASRAVIETTCPDDPARLRRLAVRFSKPVRPGQTITTRIWSTGEGAYAFETTADDGAVVIKDGLAEVADG
jgi:acyl dehydratase